LSEEVWLLWDEIGAGEEVLIAGGSVGVVGVLEQRLE